MLAALICLLLTIPVIIYLVREKRKPKSIAFFHPYCNAGGGGERVLWAAIRAMQKSHPNYKYYVYSGDFDANKEEILLKARQRFGIELDPENVEFVYLYSRRLVEADLYPHFTMLMQAIMGGFLALEALFHLVPEVFIDSMGYPLALPIFRIFAGAKVGAYVHYPTISCDMLEVVSTRQSTFNNSSLIAQSHILSILKLYYYRLFSFFYFLAGKSAKIVMVNGKWTQRHICSIWSRKDVEIVYPPCDVEAFLEIESQAENLFEETKILRILSVGQIRPEKNHRLQIEILHDVKNRLKSDVEVRLCIAGGCRNEEDRKRVEDLKAYAQELNVAENLEFKVNIPYEDLIQELSRSLISLHTMHNEHFGISVVEAMAASTILVSNDSGGPQMDIVRDFEGKCVGFLSISREEYTETILRIVEKSRETRDEIRKFARKSLERFGELAFENGWNREVEKLLKN
ncbi:unnamed protein product [Caenorhabditis angaria]|uniref:GDP-Man:Man(3)GlcNAc(2)-PP-Dol alpha-1,2-mannosyltransferase n=1 Tax=Caenorhabditis angaria TaxID=860376 RepID=A0A9P1MZ25_9PELO|nr:unnamed protein product [Caenorhabditis angaria]